MQSIRKMEGEAPAEPNYQEDGGRGSRRAEPGIMQANFRDTTLAHQTFGLTPAPSRAAKRRPAQGQGDAEGDRAALEARGAAA